MWIERVHFGLKHYHDIMQLGQVDWGGRESRFVLGCVDEEALDDVLQRGYAVQAALRWGIEQLQQGGTIYQIQSYETLWLRYIQRLTVSECSKKIGRAEDTVKQRQPKAWERLGQILGAEWENQLAVEARRAWIVQLRYEGCVSDEQRLLGFLAIFRGVVTIRVALHVNEIIFQPHLARLLERRLVMQNEQMEIVMPTPIKEMVRRNMKAAAMVRFHQLAADFYSQQGDDIETIYHWQQAGEQERAIEQLLSQYSQLDNGAMLVILEGFDQRWVSANVWAKLKLLEGRLAQQSTNLEKARIAYQSALGTDDPLIQAEVYYQLGRLYRQLNVDQSLAYFALCQQIVTNQHDQPALRLSIQALLQETWVFIDQQKDLVKAKIRLDQIEKVITTYLGDDQRVLQADIANARANYYALNQNLEQGIVYQQQAWMLARQIQDIERAMRFGYNLATAYLDSNMLTEAERMFLECQSLAQAEKNEQMVASCYKGLGGCYLQSDLRKSIQHYEHAYAYFDAADNYYWHSLTCYDLAEAHLLNSTLGDAQHYFDEGLQLATSTNNEFVCDAFEELQKTYVELSAELSPTLRQIINLTRITGKITKQMCVEQLHIKPRTANRRLNQLVELGLIQKHGEGRNVHYVLRQS